MKNGPELTCAPRRKVQVKGKGGMEMRFVQRSSEGAQVGLVSRSLSIG